MASQTSKRKLLDDSDSDSDGGGAAVEDSGFAVNKEYARRFEHNKKREERQRLEEKYKNTGREEDDDDESSSDDESEDEDGFLATEDLDVQISATLQAIRSKDPRVYDKDIKFFKEGEAATDGSSAPKEKKERPLFLKDYHREKIMRGDVGGPDDDEDEDMAPAPARTYDQEQEALKKSIVSEMHSGKAAENSESDSDGDDFMKRKEPAKADTNGVHPSRAQGLKKVEIDVDSADKHPEHFLSNFMASRAWVPEDGSRWQAFESDDGDDDDDRAETFEEAYNMRFENPEKSNEVLKSYARDIAAERSVRRDEKTGRQRKRDTEKEKKEAERRERREDKARLRKLKLEEAEAKLRKVKQAAGTTGRELQDEDWIKFLDEAWDDEGWEEEMNKRFGDSYYALEDEEVEPGDGESGASGKKKRKDPKKPTWDDDIDIKDIVPDFDEGNEKPVFSLSDDEENEEAGGDDNDEDDDNEESAPAPKKRKKSSDHKRERLASQKEARKERAKLEALVDSKIQLSNHDLLQSSSSAAPAPRSGGFRYRETSPESFGMTPRDILLAPSDAALNDFAGLKKLAAFRDEEKKRRDRKKLGKKARLRQWRRDHFGKDYETTGPTYGFEKFAAEDVAGTNAQGPTSSTTSMGNVVEGSRKKKRSR